MNIALSILKLFDITPIIYWVSIPPIDVSAVKTVMAKAEPCNELFDMAYTRGNTGAINSPSKNSDITITNMFFVAISRQKHTNKPNESKANIFFDDTFWLSFATKSLDINMAIHVTETIVVASEMLIIPVSFRYVINHPLILYSNPR